MPVAVLAHNYVSLVSCAPDLPVYKFTIATLNPHEYDVPSTDVDLL